MPVKISCSNPGTQYPDHTFFVLCKGNHSGRPMKKPCPNCFAITTENPADADFYFTAVLRLWQCRVFEPLIGGSVIPFIRLREFRGVLTRFLPALYERRDDFTKVVEQVKAIEAREAVIRQQLDLLGQLKIAILRKAI